MRQVLFSDRWWLESQHIGGVVNIDFYCSNFIGKCLETFFNCFLVLSWLPRGESEHVLIEQMYQLRFSGKDCKFRGQFGYFLRYFEVNFWWKRQHFVFGDSLEVRLVVNVLAECLEVSFLSVKVRCLKFFLWISPNHPKIFLEQLSTNISQTLTSRDCS